MNMSTCVVALVGAVAFVKVTGQVTCNLYLNETMANPVGIVQCSPSGQAGSSRGSTCLKMKASGTVFQQCSGSASADLCEHFGNPATCCTTPSNQQIICSGSSGFANPPNSADFNTCLASCGQDGTDASNAEMMS